MPTVIDSLVLELGIDADKFVRVQRQLAGNIDKTRDSVKKQGDQVEKSAKDAGEFVEKLGRQFLGLFAVVTGGRGLRDFAEWVSKSDAALGRMADNIGVSRQALYDWQNVSIRLGGSAEDATGSLEKFNHAVQQLKTGRITPEFEKLQEALSRAGTGFNAFDVLTKNPPDKALLLISEAMKKLRDEDRRLAVDQLRGIGLSESMVNALLLGGPALKAMIADIEKLGGLTKEHVEKATALQQSWARTREAGDQLGRSLVDNLAPALIGLNNDMADFISKMYGGEERVLSFKHVVDAFKSEIKTDEEIKKEFPSFEEVNRARAQHKSKRRLLGGVAPFDAAQAEKDKIGIGDLFGEEFKKGFWKKLHELESESFLLLESFKRIFRPILDWLEQKWSHLFGFGAAAAGGAGFAYGGPPLAPGAATELPGQRTPATPSYSGRPDARGQARERLQERSTAPGSGSHVKAIIDAAAAKYGVDPRIMYGIVAGESGHGQNWDFNPGTSGRPEQSYGPLQFNKLRGFGVEFQRDTGLDPAKPENFPAMADYAAKYISRGGRMGIWAGYHGLRDWNPRWGSMGVPGGVETATVGGNYGLSVRPGVESQMRGVDQKLKEVMAAAAKHLPPGYRVQVTSGYSPTHGSPGSQHRRGEAIDVQIIDQTGKPIPNRGRDYTGLYETLHRHAEGEARARYGIRMGHGINFGTSGRHPEEPDLMHFDFGGPRGHFGPRIEPVPGEQYGREFARARGAHAVHQARGRLLNRDHPISGLLRDIGIIDEERERWLARITPSKEDIKRRIRSDWNKLHLLRPHINRHLLRPDLHDHHLYAHSNITNNHHANTDTKIGEIHIHTAATDAHGIARDIKPALQRTGMAMQANFSLA